MVADGGSGEDEFIGRFFRPIATDAAARGLLDDAAILTPPADCDLVLTKDAVVAGVHFFPDDPPASIARKVMRVNLSDLAAKGARPLGALLALALPRDVTGAWMEAFSAGLGADADLYGCPILGGDTVRTPGPLTLSITAFGAVPRGRFVPRTGARPDQAIVVSGTIGDAALGLQWRLDPARPGFAALDPAHIAHLADRYLHPQPRLALAGALRDHAAAGMDVSDGLVGDVAKMLSASGCGGRIFAARVPLSLAARAAISAEPALFATALTGGDDYEIAATLPLAEVEAFLAAAREAGIPCTVIGETRAEGGLDLLGPDGTHIVLDQLSFSHF
ncbi:MAG TPA: thiamine-phosphate kinase [Xanthobacteraceae bacterium]|jgi:thiamine-monophosphate kinase|nr:MAG: thiamine-phosphate kinase [Rhizobiales bacterium 12-66-7]OYY60743.1 MAG: thiamine-phosphate kinase [Rhizobiales bacterium 35-66-30]HQS10779.1 thiamine-phosphate kinase [Xanthobacteraceae bacterium]HQS46699.1 thiamine-phosphate kinase [Xanthobacteraceae bacterium]